MTHSLYAVGDIHGCMDMLSSLMKEIELHRKRHPSETATLVFLGDYIDRGPDSKSVLEFVRNLDENGHPLFDEVVALRGNHEQMMIDADNQYSREMWLYNGGIQTLNSFNWNSTRDTSVRNIIGAENYSWTKNLSKWFTIGSIALAHAGIDDPNRSAEYQEFDSLIWSRHMRRDRHKIYKYTIHGHTPMDRADVGEHVAYIDTGAVFGGKLTCLYIRDCDNIEYKETIDVR